MMCQVKLDFVSVKACCERNFFVSGKACICVIQSLLLCQVKLVSGKACICVIQSLYLCHSKLVNVSGKACVK